MHICVIVGARPNFMKGAPLVEALRSYSGAKVSLVHTGQHYSANLSDLFFDQLGLPRPEVNLGVGSDSHVRQIARIMEGLQDYFVHVQPDVVVVVGDVNSTLAAALVANKLMLPLAHVEAGLRSFDRSMPEETNRVLTDAVSHLLFTTEPSANENLKREGIGEGKVHFVGNLMIDTLQKHRPKAIALRMPRSLGLQPRNYALLTLHRPANVDTFAQLRRILSALEWIQKEMPVVFPMHPRTSERIYQFGFETVLKGMTGLRCIEPMGYLEFLGLMDGAAVVLTDSGGIQEETTCLGVPCLTLRNNTERPVTVNVGTNELVGNDPERIIAGVSKVLSGSWKKGRLPDAWDGHAAKRVADVLLAADYHQQSYR